MKNSPYKNIGRLAVRVQRGQQLIWKKTAEKTADKPAEFELQLVWIGDAK